MKIEKHLKRYSFWFDFDKMELVLFKPGSLEEIHIDKVGFFSLARFFIRVSQKLSTYRKPKRIGMGKEE